MHLPLADGTETQDAWLTILQLLVTLLSFPTLAALLTGVTTLFSASRRRRASITRDLAFLNEMPDDLAGRSAFKLQIEGALDRLLEAEAPRAARRAGVRGERARGFSSWFRSSSVPVIVGAVLSVAAGIVLSIGLGEVSFGSLGLWQREFSRWSLFAAAVLGVVPVVALFAFAARRRAMRERDELAREVRSRIRSAAAKTRRSKGPDDDSE